MIRVAGSTFAFSDMGLEDSCKIMQEMGFDIVDVGGCGWSTFKEIVSQQVVENLDDVEGEADKIRRITEKYGLEVAELFCCDFGDNINHPDPERRARSQEIYEKMVGIGQKAGFQSIMMLPGVVHEDLGQSADEAFDISVQEFRRMVDVAESHGLNCNIEACIGSIALHPNDATKLIEAVPGLGLTLDYAHQTQLALGADDIEPLHKYARHFHAKQSAPGEFQAKPDDGVIDFGRMIRKMKADEFDGSISVEFVTSQEILDTGWDVRKESARLKEILDKAISAE